MVRLIGRFLVLFGLLALSVGLYCFWIAASIPGQVVDGDATEVAGAALRVLGWIAVGVIGVWGGFQLTALGLVAVNDEVYDDE